MNTTIKNYKLFAEPSFWEGIARLVDFSGSLNEYNLTKSTKVNEYLGLKSDWENIGNDINVAMNQFEKDIHD